MLVNIEEIAEPKEKKLRVSLNLEGIYLVESDTEFNQEVTIKSIFVPIYYRLFPLVKFIKRLYKSAV